MKTTLLRRTSVKVRRHVMHGEGYTNSEPPQLTPKTFETKYTEPSPVSKMGFLGLDQMSTKPVDSSIERKPAKAQKQVKRNSNVDAKVADSHVSLGLTCR